LLEVWTNSEDLVNQILHTDNAVFTKAVLDNGVIGESNTLLVNLSISALVDELTDGLEVWISVGDPRLNDLQHLKCSFGHANKDTIVDLEQTEELEDLSWFWCDLVDTRCMLERVRLIIDHVGLPLDTDNKDQLVFGWNVERTVLFGCTSKADLFTLLVTVLLDVLFGTLEDDTALLLLGLQ
jgi:hypothetical protein